MQVEATRERYGRARLRTSTCIALLTATLALPVPAAAGSVSSKHRIDQFSLNPAGEPVESAGYHLKGSYAQEATVGTSASASYVLQSGFWGFAGAGQVPIVLRVDSIATPSLVVELDWSGITSPYDVYRSVDCTAVLDPPRYLDTTVENHYADGTSPETGLTCYLVVPNSL